MSPNSRPNPNRLIALAGVTVALAAGALAIEKSQEADKPVQPGVVTTLSTEHSPSVLPATNPANKGYDNISDPRSVEAHTETQNGVTVRITP